jgi:hypothetical protein
MGIPHFVVQSLMSGYLGCCCECCYKYSWTGFYLVVDFKCLAIHLGVELLPHMLTLTTFWGTARVFPKAAAPFHIPHISVQDFQFLCVLTRSCYLLCVLLIIAISVGLKWYLIMGLIFHFSDGWWCLTSVPVLPFCLHMFFREMSIKFLPRSLKIGISFYWVMRVFYIFCIRVSVSHLSLSLSLSHILQYLRWNSGLCQGWWYMSAVSRLRLRQAWATGKDRVLKLTLLLSINIFNFDQFPLYV